MTAMDVPTDETLAFITSHVRPSSRLLEVGCGNGLLASRLQVLGYEVIALDSNPAVVEQARSLGVDARAATWPEFAAAPFDAILFTRSLHHIHPLGNAVSQARKLLKEKGMVLVEDFAYDDLEPACAEWFYQCLVLLEATGLIVREGDHVAAHLLRHDGAFAAWRESHGQEHQLHSAQAMHHCLRKHFPSTEMNTVPYVYRYGCAALPASEIGYRVAARLLALERRMAEQGRFHLIGRRLVCRT
jgi:2-polyprenyl-3-methyl-5-hydroxy-6-metoxy-1,4-benzoquinol methylase